MRKENRENRPAGFDMGASPLIEMVGNRQIIVEGSTGILLYEPDNIKINTNRMVICFYGRNLALRCVSESCVEIDGYVCKMEFVC